MKFRVLVPQLPFGGRTYYQGQVIETGRDLEADPKYTHRVRQLAADGKTVLPALSKRVAAKETKDKEENAPRHRHRRAKAADESEADVKEE